MNKQFLHMLACLWLCLALAACAGAPPPRAAAADSDVTASETTANPLAIYDPWTGFNRRMYQFNAWFDDVLLLPIVRGYRAVTPKPVRKGVGNFFSNLGEITTFANAALQLKPEATLTTLSLFVINTTLGIGGLFDPASRLGLQQYHEDFGQTLGHYGVNSGPYLVLPFLGPSTLRDSFGLGADQYGFYVLDPLYLRGHDWVRTAYWALYAINTRDKVNFRYYQTGSPFEYELVRFIYMNYRALQVAE